MRKALTDALVRNIAPPATGRAEVADLREAGLSFRVTASGARSWCFRFRDPRSGKTTRATIGRYPDVSLGKARERAEAMRKEVGAGANPVESKRREREMAASKAFKALADRYLDEHARRKKRSADADERNLRLHVLPKWKNRRFDEIARKDVIELVESLVTARAGESRAGAHFVHLQLCHGRRPGERQSVRPAAAPRRRKYRPSRADR
jgi:hypothetical protein